MMYGYGMGGLGWFAMSLASLLFWTALIAGAILLVRALIRSGDRGAPATPSRAEPPATSGPAHLSPGQVLADRFARGEIDEQEFRARLTALRDADQLVKH